MASHKFAFAGGEILTEMGASWFVSYAYYDKVDRTHQNWARVATAQTRISKYNKGRPFHKDWLNEVLIMNSANLNKNTIGLDPYKTKALAKELLDKWE